MVNILRHPDFSDNWVAAGTAVKDASVTCLNAPSVKLTANGGSCLYRQEVTLEGGKKYTLSAYAKCQNVDGIFGTYVRLSKKSNPLDCVTSTGIYGTTEGALNNGMAADGWERVCVTLDRTSITGSEAYYAELVLASTGGTAWFACPQLEEGGVMNHVNLLSNGDFRYTAASGTQILPLD